MNLNKFEEIIDKLNDLCSEHELLTKDFNIMLYENEVMAHVTSVGSSLDCIRFVIEGDNILLFTTMEEVL